MKKSILPVLLSILVSAILMMLYYGLEGISKDRHRGNGDTAEESLRSNKTLIIPENISNEEIQRRYNDLKTSIANTKQKFKSSYNKAQTNKTIKIIINEAKKYLFKVFSKKIFPMWIGTKWDYNGTTETPRMGNIACGYFVTTTIKHAGFNINRYKLAQQPASIIINTLCYKKTIKTFNGVKKALEYLEKQNNSLYIVGLDSHVGFIEKTNKGIFFVHAGFMKSGGVIKEDAYTSRTLALSKIVMTGNFLDNAYILKSWINGD